MNFQRNRGKQQNGEDWRLQEENGDTEGTFHAKMGTIKDRNGKDLQKQKRLRRGGKNKHKNCTKKILMTQITMMVWSLT